jgi:hypothetical protein
MTDTGSEDPKDSGNERKKDRASAAPVLSGTTLRVYRFLYRQAGKPVGFHDVQRGCGLSSPSLAQYHIRKLVDSGLVKEEDSGYIVDRVLFENMIRIRRSIVPLQVTFSVFFATTLILLLTLLRPQLISPTYIFSIAVNVAALGVFGYEAFSASRERSL